MKQLFSLEKKDFVFLFLLLFFLGDITYSYYQHSLAPIDGDLPALVAPSDAYQQVLQDPFGFKIVQTGKNCAASNRFFVQWATYSYFRHVPLWLQSFLSPIDSVYASMAIAKTFLQAGLILLIAAYIRFTFGWKRNETMLAVVLLCPLFQTTGFFEYLCMIDNCTSYAFAYASSTLLLLIFLLPYYRAAVTGRSSLPVWIQPLWLVLPVVLAFSGPLTGPVLLLLCPSTLLYLFYSHWKKLSNAALVPRLLQSVFAIPKKLLLSFTLTTLLCIYSFYIGTHNSENAWVEISLLERYHRLLEGLIRITSFQEGLSPLVLAVLFNLFILYRSKHADLEKLLQLFGMACLFAVVYCFLLPLGGYRSYRPFIVRRDTLQPVLVLIFFAWGITTVCVLTYLQSIKRLGYALGVTGICLLYTVADKLPGHINACERASLEILAASREECVKLNESCTVMQWNNTTECADTRYGAQLLHVWNITSKEIKYHH